MANSSLKTHDPFYLWHTHKQVYPCNDVIDNWHMEPATILTWVSEVNGLTPLTRDGTFARSHQPRCGRWMLMLPGDTEVNAKHLCRSCLTGRCLSDQCSTAPWLEHREKARGKIDAKFFVETKVTSSRCWALWLSHNKHRWPTSMVTQVVWSGSCDPVMDNAADGRLSLYHSSIRDTCYG